VKRGQRVLLAVSTVALLGVFLWVGLASRHNTAQTGLIPVQVRLKWLHQAQFAGFYVAQQQGFYKREGLQVMLNAGGVDFPAIQLVAVGGEQFGVTGADQIILAREKGAPVVAVAVIYQRSPMVFFALQKSGISSPKQFEGKRVGVKLGGNEELTYRALIRNAGVDPRRVKEIPVKYDMTPLFTGQVDVWPGYTINEVIVAQEQGFEVNVIQPADYGVDLYADALFTTETTLREHPEMVRKFVKATMDGWQYAIDHPEQGVDDTLRYSDKLNPAHETKMLTASIPLVKVNGHALGWMDLAKWRHMEELLKTQGFIKSDVDVQKAFTNDFIAN
jgi:NitT/TauT family transport system substrate-binding protein